MTDARPHRAALLPEEAARRFGHLGVDVAIGRKLLAASVLRGEPDLSAVRSVKKSLLAELERQTRAEPLAVHRREAAADGFVKYLFALHDGQLVEAVRIPVPCEAPGADLSAFEGKEKKYIVCVSSQAGCALACAFCATGQLGFQRNLAAHEIVGQVLAIRDERRWWAPPSTGPEAEPEALGDRPVRGVVFMGMGEPFLNYDEVIRAAKVLSHPCGAQIDGRAITVSTAGIVPAIRRFTAEGHKHRLAVSLTQANAKKRLPLMPIEGVHPLPELVAALHDHARARRTRVLVEYVLLGGVNDGPEDAQALIGLLDPKLVKLDLIDVNGEVGGFRRSDPARRAAFIGALAAGGMPFGIRYSGGQDVLAGCGQLASCAEGTQPGARLPA